MYTIKKIIVFLIFFILSVSQFNFRFVSAQQENNVTIQVDVVETYANATYREYHAFNAEVNLFFRANHNINYTGYTDIYGIIEFYVNVTGMYDLEINYPNTYYINKSIYIRSDGFNTFYEKVYKLARFFEGSQNTVARKIILDLPASLSINFPISNVNFTVKSYGMTVKTYKSNTWFTIEFKDPCSPIVNPETGMFFTPNYTVYVNLTTLAGGVVSYTSVSNGTINTDFSNMYYVPADVTVSFKFIVITEIPKYMQQLEQINAKLDRIIALLLQLIDLTNHTVIPKLGGIEYSLSNFTVLMTKKINDMLDTFTANMSILNVFSDKISDIHSIVKGIRDTQNVFVNDYPFQTRNVLTESLGDLNQTFYANIFLLIIGLILLVFRTRKTREETKEIGTVVVKE